MTDQLPGRTPPWGLGVWAYPARPQVHPVRVGDAERDEALDKLGDHFAAGRLTREEFDERSETAMGARFDSDLEVIFRDLPGDHRGTVARPERPRLNRGLSVAVALLVPLLVLAVVASIVTRVPVLIAPVVW